MEESIDTDFQAKVGQFIYNYLVTENMRELILRRALSRGLLKFEIPLGEDRAGNLVVMHISIMAKKLVPVPRGEPEPQEQAEQEGAVEGGEAGPG